MNIDNIGLARRRYRRHMTGENFFAAYYLLGGQARRVFEARFYASRSNRTVWCAAWISAGGKWGRGAGCAGGWGYDRASAALSEALDSMGVRDLPPISGRGMGRALDVLKEGLEPIIGQPLYRLVAGA